MPRRVSSARAEKTSEMASFIEERASIIVACSGTSTISMRVPSEVGANVDLDATGLVGEARPAIDESFVLDDLFDQQASRLVSLATQPSPPRSASTSPSSPSQEGSSTISQVSSTGQGSSTTVQDVSHATKLLHNDRGCGIMQSYGCTLHSRL